MAKRRSWALEIGANVSEAGVFFRVWAPRASSVSLVLLPGQETHRMHSEERGYFSILVRGLSAGARYAYLLNEDRLRPDPVSRLQPEGVHGPSEVVDPSTFQWQDRDWKGIPPEEMAVYEIHTGTLTPEGTFDAIVPFLDYLRNELGVTAIELMPVAQFPGERNWGYDGTYLYAPQNSYGGPSGLKRLVQACHRTGLAVILDVVYNHFGPEGNYLGEYGPYFTDRYHTPWGSAVNFDGAGSDAVRRFVVENALYWATEYHVDGLRIDAVHGIFDFSARHILEDIRESVHRQARQLGRRIAVIAESDLNDVRILNPPAKGGYGLDAQWNDDFHHCLHTLLTGERSGYYEDFGRLDQLAKALREGFVYTGQYSTYRRRTHGSSSRHLSPGKFVAFSQNHDQVGNRMKGDRLSTLVPFEALKLAAGIVLLSSEIPLLFMGEEYGEEAPFLYFVSHSDPGLIEAVRKGRREEFAAFGWKGEVPDPQSETAFSSSKIHPEMRFHGEKKTLLALYRALLRLRKQNPSIAAPEKRGIEIRAFEEEKVILIERRRDGNHTLCFFNFAGEPREVETELEAGTWEKALASCDAEWGGKGVPVPESFQSAGSEVLFVLDAYSFAVYKMGGRLHAGLP